MFRRERVKLKEREIEKRGRERNRGRGRVKWRSSEKMRDRETKERTESCLERFITLEWQNENA